MCLKASKGVRESGRESLHFSVITYVSMNLLSPEDKSVEPFDSQFALP